MGLSWKDGDTVAPAVLLVGGIAYGVTAWGYGLGTGAQPGPGLFPFAIAVALVLSAMAWLVVTARRRPGDAEESVPLLPVAERDDPGAAPPVADAAGGAVPEDPDERLDWVRIAGVTVSAALVIPLSTWVGLVAAAAALATVTALLMRARWVTAVLIGVLFGLLGFLVFEHWLEVPLPDGFFFTQGRTVT